MLAAFHDPFVRSIRRKAGCNTELSVEIIDSQITKVSNICRETLDMMEAREQKGEKDILLLVYGLDAICCRSFGKYL